MKIRNETALIESNRQRVKSVSQIAAEGMELQRVESERAKKRMSEGAKGCLKSDTLERSDENVAASLGISRDRWFKLKTIFQKVQSGDAEAKELMKALDAGDISVNPVLPRGDSPELERPHRSSYPGIPEHSPL